MPERSSVELITRKDDFNEFVVELQELLTKLNAIEVFYLITLIFTNLFFNNKVHNPSTK